MQCEMPDYILLIKWLYPQTEMIDVFPLSTWSSSPAPAKATAD